MIVEIWSDVVCPWCYIGRERLKRAMQDLGCEHDVTLVHRAFQLQPDADTVAPTRQHLATKFRASPQQVDQMFEHVTQVASDDGLSIDLASTLSGNTSDAHRLALWAQDQGVGDGLIDQMFSQYFTQGTSVFDEESLLGLASGAGLDQQAARDMLRSDAFTHEVVEDQSLANEFGITGVPYFAFDRRLAVSGAQPAELFSEALQRTWPALGG